MSQIVTTDIDFDGCLLTDEAIANLVGQRPRYEGRLARVVDAQRAEGMLVRLTLDLDPATP